VPGGARSLRRWPSWALIFREQQAPLTKALRECVRCVSVHNCASVHSYASSARRGEPAKLEPVYALASCELAGAPAARFLRDATDVSDIEGARCLRSRTPYGHGRRLLARLRGPTSPYGMACSTVLLDRLYSGLLDVAAARGSLLAL
jgi:hypothetical protein